MILANFKINNSALKKWVFIFINIESQFNKN